MLRTESWIKACVLVVVVMCAPRARASGQEVSAGAAPCSSAKECVDRAARAYLLEGGASAVQVAIWKEGRFVYSSGFGFADPQHDRPVTRRSLFQIGSNTKKATALAVMRAIEGGGLALDQPLSRVLPLFRLERTPGWTNEVTLRDLLSHQSGLWDYTPGYDAPDDRDLQRTLWGVFAKNEWAPTPPGSVWNYANANYAVLASVLERAYRRAYADVMEREVYRPLAMNDTYARRDAAIATGRAVWGYGAAQQSDDDVFDPVELITNPPWATPPAWVSPAQQADNAFLRAAGLTWSTAEDECRVGVALLGGARHFLSDASRRELVSAQAEMTPGDSGIAYGFGLMVADGLGLGRDEFYEVPSWSHSGSTLTMSSYFLVLPTQGLILSVLRNARDRQDIVQPLISAAVQHYAALPPKSSPPMAEPESGARYAGEYSDPEGLGTLSLVWDGAVLTASAPELSARGVTVDRNVSIQRRNLLVLTINGAPFALTAWPSAESDVGYLVGREDSFTRVAGQ